VPELPDLEVIKEYLQGVLPGQQIEEVELLRPLVVRNLIAEDFVSALVENQFGDVGRRGKFLLFDLKSGEKLVVKPMLAGRLQYCHQSERRQAKTFRILHLSGSVDRATQM